MTSNLTCVAVAALMFCAVLSDHAKAQVIDCDTAGPNALQNAINSGSYPVRFTGTCNEDIGIYWDNVHLIGNDTDPRQNVINGEVNIAVTEDIDLENLKITGDNFSITNEAFVFMDHVVVEGTAFGVFIARNSGAIMNNVFIGPALVDDGTQSCVPLCIGENSHVRMLNSTVNGATSDPVGGGAITVYRDASLTLRGGNTVTNSGSQPVIAVFSDSSVRQDDSQDNGTGTITAGTGLAVSVVQTATFDTREAVITGDIEVVGHAFMNVGSTVFGGDPSLMVIDGDIELGRDSALTVSSPLVTINGVISCHDDESSAVGDFAGSGSNTCSGFDAEVVRDDGTAQFLVEENAASTANRSLVRLENNGNPQIALSNTQSGVNWKIGMGPSNSFFAKKGSRELRFTEGGALRLLASGNTFLLALPNGNLVIDGTLTEGSDVNAKRDIAPVDGASVLTQVASLPVSTWRYKDDQTGARHVGPMAQDFYAAFGLGSDDTRISPRDVASVALVAVKELQEVVRETQGELREKETEIASLKDRLRALEGLVAGLVGKRVAESGVAYGR
ncbi:MAG: tail fiber domain-containing protein [Kiloniellales bacterium]|nr:tail fiber domain-containing protein [Kiloniellales bacterium]